MLVHVYSERVYHEFDAICPVFVCVCIFIIFIGCLCNLSSYTGALQWFVFNP